MDQESLIKYLDSCNDPEIKSTIILILQDRSIFDDEKEQMIKDLLTSVSHESNNEETVINVDDFSVESLDFKNLMIFNLRNKETFYYDHEDDIFQYVLDNNLKMEDIVVYRKQQIGLKLENAN